MEPLEKAVLVCQVSNTALANPYILNELHELAVTAGVEVCARLVAVRSRQVAATYIGKGKTAELADMVAQNNATLVIFNHSISPVQERNIEKVIQCRVLGRSGLILDIFAQRATSSEGKIQVELAQLKHLSTRLVRGWTHLERQKGGVGLRGPGESQLETDRRLIGQRIRTLTRCLRRVESQRQLRRRARQRAPIPTISLVGYTNAGKSSLFCALTGANVLVEDRLFSTLDPTMRRVDLPGVGGVVLSDTVGFVRDLPHSLIAAFHSTLEEVVSSSCLLLVTDIVAADFQETRKQVLRVLDEIGAGEIPVIDVYNKIDVSGHRPCLKTHESGMPKCVWLSAKTREGIDNLLQGLDKLIGSRHQNYCLRLLPQAGELRSRLFQKCDVLSENCREDGSIILQVRMPEEIMGWLQSQQRYQGQWTSL